VLAELAYFDRDLVAFAGDRRGRDRAKLDRRLRLKPANAVQQLPDDADEAVGEGEDDGDQRDADDQFPDIGQAAGEVGACDLDAKRADDGADDRAAAAERDHDDQPRPEREACVLGCRDRAERGIAEAGKSRDDGGQHQDNDAGARGIDAEIGAARVVVAKRGEEAAGIAAHDDQRRDGDGDQAEAREAEPILEREIERLEADEPAGRAGERAAGIQDLHQHDRNDQGDDRGIERRRTWIERQPAGQCGHRHRDDDGGAERHERLPGAEAIFGESDCQRIDADPEKRRLAEGQRAAIAPHDVDGDRRDRNEERSDQDIHQICVEQQRRHDDDAGHQQGHHRERHPGG
jgi:hypothetical protein